ncbi:MAG: N-acetylmuramoyl-L-alanine amidase [Myxococcota bacterium]
MRTAWLTCLATLLVLPLVGCEETPVRGGLPACEPPEELVLERGLKTGFRALSEQRWEAAKGAFEAVLESAPGHPEARAGLRAASTLPATTTRGPQHRGLIIGEHELQTQQPINHDHMRLETRRAEHEVAKQLGKRPSSKATPFARRAPNRPTQLTGIDLIVLHATGTVTALERFVKIQYSEESTHFLIDWDGQVYQTLDVGLIAQHTRSRSLDARSISIELVTPTAPQDPPLPSHADGIERPMSQRVRVQGKVVRNWGYTSLQMTSLNRLLEDLVRLLPDLNLKPPGGAEVPLKALPAAKRATVRGVIGRMHIDPRSESPGPGFDWTAIHTDAVPTSP